MDEEATRARMRELAEQGDVAGAIGEYAKFEHEARAALGAEPSRETKRLLDELLAQAPPPLGRPHQIGRRPSEPA
jgi:DNA-binding SARP family transcriptional activator